MPRWGHAETAAREWLLPGICIGADASERNAAWLACEHISTVRLKCPISLARRELV
jgi:hypothetical protein